MSVGLWDIEYGYIKLYSVALSDGVILKLSNEIDLNMKSSHLLVYYDFRAFYTDDYIEIMNSMKKGSVTYTSFPIQLLKIITGNLISIQPLSLDDCINNCSVSGSCVGISRNNNTGLCSLFSTKTTINTDANTTSAEKTTATITDGITKTSGVLETGVRINCSKETFYDPVSDSCIYRQYGYLNLSSKFTFSNIFISTYTLTELAFEMWFYPDTKKTDNTGNVNLVNHNSRYIIY